MDKHDDLLSYYEARDRILHFSALTIRKMKGDRVLPYSEDILKFLSHYYRGAWPDLYIDQSRKLIEMQREFERADSYPAASYTDVKPVETDTYNLRLLLSFITVINRFEILETLVDFIKTGTVSAQELLSVGVGSGYEMKLCHDYLRDWNLQAYEKSEAACNYARTLLSFFGSPSDCIRSELFPLEFDDGVEPLRNRFGKIILCEVLEHLEDPVHALMNLKKVLHPDGAMMLTMAINISQEDHIFRYRTIEQAQQQVTDCGLSITHELVSPLVIFPFQESEREQNFEKGNYICIVKK